MDANSESILQQLSHADFLGNTNNGLAVDHLDMPVACGFCGRTLSEDGEVNSSLETVNICGDCKFLLLEDLGNQAHDSHQRRLHRRGRSTHGSSELIEGRLTQQFSQMINLARHIDHEQEDLPEDDTNMRLHQPASSRTTPSDSRRWGRIVSDTESDGFNSDSFYGESESNVSFGTYRVSYGDGESVSFSADGGDSDASVDGHTFFDRDIFVPSIDRSDTDSDSDIDPMHAGAVQWNSDDHEAEDYEWEEVDAEEHAAGSPESGAHNISNERGDPSIRHTTDYPEFEEMMIRWRGGEGRQTGIPSILTSMEEFGSPPYLGSSGDYLDARGFEEFLEHLAETDSSRRGAPPAAASFVNCLPLTVVSEEHQKPDGLSCAICKDLLAVGAQANQLPCLHLYHPSCILPWLSARNTCPLCRYELPTDDMDYEQRKLNARGHSRSRMVITEIQRHDGGDDSSSVISDSNASEMNEAQEPRELSGNVGAPEDAIPTNGGRGRWLFLAAAPIVSLMGVVFVLWLGNPLTRARRQIGQHNLYGQRAQHIRSSDTGHNQRVRRWWWWF